MLYEDNTCFFLVEPYQYTQIFKFSMTCFKPIQIDPIPVMARLVPGLFILSEDSFIRSMPDGTPEWHGTYSRWFFQRSYHGAEICRCYQYLTAYCMLIGCFRFNDILRRHFSLFWAVSQTEGETGELHIVNVCTSFCCSICDLERIKN